MSTLLHDHDKLSSHECAQRMQCLRNADADSCKNPPTLLTVILLP